MLLLLLPVREVVQRLVLLLAVVMVATIPLQAEATKYKMGDKVSEWDTHFSTPLRSCSLRPVSLPTFRWSCMWTKLALIITHKRPTTTILYQCVLQTKWGCGCCCTHPSFIYLSIYLSIYLFISKVEHRSLTLGEVLDGDRMAVSMYEIHFNVSSPHNELCTRELSNDDIEKLQLAIEDLYYFEFIFGEERERERERERVQQEVIKHLSLLVHVCITQLDLYLTCTLAS